MLRKLIRKTALNHDYARLENMFLFNIWLMQREFGPKPPDTDVSIETWLSKTNYTRREKDSLLNTYNNKPELDKKDFVCKCFVKAETYPEYKAFRPIKSRTDRFKIEVGPWFQLINEVLFAHPQFIKKIPVNQRPHYINDMLGWATKFSCTDFSKYESHFTELIMKIIELPFYEFCTHLIPGSSNFIKLIRKVLPAKQKFVYKYFESEINATRASGEMCTSSGNGYTNFFLFHYISNCLGAEQALGVFEGDDGLTTVLPTTAMPETHHYEELGFLCKMEVTEEFSEASFCGLVADKEELINVCDVRAAIADLGWTTDPYINASEKTLKALLRAKGYSLVYQYAGCPILDALGHYILRNTHQETLEKKLNKILTNMDKYKRDLFIKAIENKIPPRKQPGPKTRLLVEKMYGVSIKTQLAAEEFFDKHTELTHFYFDLNCPILWYENYMNYVTTSKHIFEYPKESEELIDKIVLYSQADVATAWCK